jgi:hypothetical protein
VLKDPDHLGPPADLLLQPLKGSRGEGSVPTRFQEVHVSRHIVDAALKPTCPLLVCADTRRSNLGVYCSWQEARMKTLVDTADSGIGRWPSFAGCRMVVQQ